MPAATNVLLLTTLVSVSRLCQCRAQISGDFPVMIQVTEPRTLAEGPHWDSTQQVLYYVDILGNTLHRFDPNTTTEETITFDQPLGLAVPIKDQKNKFVVALGRELRVLTWDWDFGFSETSLITTVDSHQPRNRFNDGKADANGRIFAGTMGYEDDSGVELNKATLYRLDNNPSVPCSGEPVVSPVSISNGMAWSSNNRILYYIDTPTRRVDAFDYNLTTGALANRRPVFEFARNSVEGNPDGMTIDIDGNLWIACWNGSQVIQIDPTTGKLLRQIKLPVERVTSVVFGGPRLNTLFVTTARAGLTSDQLQMQPQAGSVFQFTNIKAIGTPSKTAVINCKCVS